MSVALRKAVAVVRDYADHPDQRVASANLIALVVASNQPFYPLYLLWLVGEQITPAWFTFLSTPFFLAVPAVARKNSVAGRALLPIAGIGNTILCAWLFGVPSAVEIFLIPCAVISLLVFRPSERFAGFALAGAALGTFLFLHGAYGTPLVTYSLEEYAALARLNAVSAAMLAGFVALLFSNVLAEAERSAEPRSNEKTG